MYQYINLEYFTLLISTGDARYNASVDFQCFVKEYAKIELRFIDLYGLRYANVYKRTLNGTHLQSLKLSGVIDSNVRRVQILIIFGPIEKKYLLKFLIIGCASTGKTCILHQFIENKFKTNVTHTIGAEFGSKIININQKNIKLQIWDTAGQERFRSVTRSYYRGASGALLVYDITNRESYNTIANWLSDARQLASSNIVIILCGNKKDLEDQRQVTFIEANQFAQDNDLIFVETSAMTGENIYESFLQCAQIILNKIDSGSIDRYKINSSIQSALSTANNRSENSLDDHQLRNKSIKGCALCQT
ncbi:unnamed protein product [Rotaria sp. Silwood1]|nr:unnamed protein product [Rotaria sp. Silwood1]